MKTELERIQDYVARSTTDDIANVIQSLLHGMHAGINGMQGKNWLPGYHRNKITKKSAIESALSYCKIVNDEVSSKLFK